MGRDGSGDWGSTEACLVVLISEPVASVFCNFHGFFVVFLIRLVLKVGVDSLAGGEEGETSARVAVPAHSSSRSPKTPAQSTWKALSPRTSDTFGIEPVAEQKKSQDESSRLGDQQVSSSGGNKESLAERSANSATPLPHSFEHER